MNIAFCSFITGYLHNAFSNNIALTDTGFVSFCENVKEEKKQQKVKKGVLLGGREESCQALNSRPARHGYQIIILTTSNFPDSHP